eukprot:14886805-Alexandrium_andersonii.AAC.1
MRILVKRTQGPWPRADRSLSRWRMRFSSELATVQKDRSHLSTASLVVDSSSFLFPQSVMKPFYLQELRREVALRHDGGGDLAGVLMWVLPPSRKRGAL